MLARLVLLPRDDPQFRRNRERIVRDAERELISHRVGSRAPRGRRLNELGTGDHGGRDGGGGRIRRALPQPRAELARLQRSGAVTRRRARHPAARAGQVLRDLLGQPRRVLPGPRRRAEGPDRGRHRPTRRPTDELPAQQLAEVGQPCSSDSSTARKRSSSTISFPRWRRAGVDIVGWADLGTDRPQGDARRCYDERIFPVLTPLAVDPGHPFPYISNLALSLAVNVADPETGERRFARLKVPNVFPRLVALDGRSVPARRAADRGQAPHVCSSA